jgi:hypothetical protein
MRSSRARCCRARGVYTFLNIRSARRVVFAERGNLLRAHHYDNSRIIEHPHTSIFWNASPTERHMDMNDVDVNTAR